MTIQRIAPSFPPVASRQLKGVMAFKPEASSNKNTTELAKSPTQPTLDSAPKIGNGESRVRPRQDPTMFERLQKAFGTSAGEEGYDSSLDLDNNGEIGPGDFALVSQLDRFMRTESAFEAFQRAFGSEKGDANYQEGFDFDSDGEIGPGDFAILAEQRGPSGSAEDRFRAAFGSEKGDANYDVTADFDQDGQVGPTDFAMFAEASKYRW